MADETYDTHGRYDSQLSDDGFVEIYDTQNEDAWVRSDAAVDLDLTR